jgi:hypothetical protein
MCICLYSRKDIYAYTMDTIILSERYTYALLDEIFVLRRTCRQSSLCETLFHCNILSKHHHHHLNVS